jgi:hypothetical protein
MMRWVLRAAMVPAALALGVFLLLRAALPELDGEWQPDTSGPAARVTLERDAAGVPTVRGASIADVAYGLGVAPEQCSFRGDGGVFSKRFARNPHPSLHGVSGLRLLGPNLRAVVEFNPFLAVDQHSGGAQALCGGSETYG